MTPSRSTPDSAVPRKSPSEPEPQVAEELRAIDTLLLDKLIEIRAEQKQLEAYRSKAGNLKDTVKGPVWQRVMADYTTRLTALEEQAAPLTTEVLREYQKLRALHDRLAAAHEDARLAKEELEFRETVGELSKEDVKARLESPERALSECQRDLAAVQAQKAKFVDAIGSDAALEAPPLPVPAPASPLKSESAPPAKAAASAEPRAATRVEGDAEPKKVEPKAEPKPVAKVEAKPKPPVTPTMAVPVPAPVVESQDATRVVLRSELAPPAPEPPIAPAAAPAPAGDQHTFLLPQATLSVTLGKDAPTEHRLGPITYLGRTEDNQIQLPRPGVSRRHAVIELTQSGFALKDLGSQNGTFVNGDTVSTHPLADGDRILIGDAQIVFRLL